MAINRSLLFTPKIIDNVAPDDVFLMPTTPATSLLVNGRVRFSNVTAGAITITAWAIPSGGTAINGTLCLPTVSISANSYLDMDIPQLGVSGKLQARAGAAASINVQPMDGFINS